MSFNPTASTPATGSVSMGPMPVTAQVYGSRTGGVYYRARDARGHEYIADSKDGLPEALRARAERVELRPAARVDDSGLASAAGPIGWPSFALGFGIAALIGVIAVVAMRRGFGLPIKLVLLGAVVLVLGAAYFGWLRRVGGQTDSVLATPSALIEDARRTVEKANQRQREQERLLNEIEQPER